MSPAASSLPIILVPVGVDEDALDACLAALDAGTPAGSRVWLADDAQAGPRATAIIEAWLKHTPLQGAHTRRAASIGEAAHLDEALRACGNADVAILASDARPAPGWLQELAACLARDPTIATATPWSNAGEAASWPRVGEIAGLEEAPSRLARACACSCRRGIRTCRPRLATRSWSAAAHACAPAGWTRPATAPGTPR